MLSSHHQTREFPRGRIVLVAALSLMLLLALSGVAQAAAPSVVPAGGGFEQAPLTYTTSDTCGLLCKDSTTRQAEGSNHYLDTKYSSLLGVIGTSTAHTTITSPQFTWSQATPSAIALALDRRSALGSFVSLGGSVNFDVVLVDDTSSTSSTISAEELSSSEAAFHAFSTSVPATDLVEGHTYKLVFTEEFDALLGLSSTASIDLDNVGLEVTPAASGASVGTTTVEGLTEHSASTSTTLDAHGQATTYAIEYGTTTGYGSSTAPQSIPAGGEGSQQVGATLSGLAPGTGYHLRFRAESAGGTTYGTDVAFTTAPTSPPTVGPPSVGSITGSGAILSATVNPGATDTGVQVDYGTTTAYGLATGTQTILAGSGATGAQIQLSGLAPSTTYHAKLLATNADGSVESSDIQFTTSNGGVSPAPAIGPSSASELTEHSAGLETTVDTHGEAATYDVQYGTTVLYGSTTSPQTILAGGSGALPEITHLSGLLPGTTYHARFVVADGGGTSFGIDVVFTTAPAAPPTISAASVGSVTEAGSTVSATIDPEASNTNVHVDYGISTSYGQSTSSQLVTSAGGSTVVHIPLSGLSPSTTYHALLVATNADGSTESHDLTFTTDSEGTEGASTGEPPSIIATTVDGESTHSAVVHATIDSHGLAASYEVQYGSSTSYGSLTLPRGLSGAGGATPVSVTLSGLTPSSLYHARFRVLTEAGTSLGADVAFTTLSVTTNHGGETTTTGGGGTTTSPAVTVATGPPTAATCLRVQARVRGLALHLLRVPGVSEISPSHPLHVTLAKSAGTVRRLRYSIGGAALANGENRHVNVMPSQIQSGRGTSVRVLLTDARHKTRTLRLTLVGSPCGAKLLFNRSGARAQVILRRLTASRRVMFTLPSSLGSPSNLTLVTTSKNRAFRIHASRAGLLRLSPEAGGVRVQRNGRRIAVTGLGSQITGLLLRFSTHRVAGGSILARVTSAAGRTQTLQVAAH